MPNLHDIERRISSVESTKQITRTMQMVSAAKIRHSQERVDHATPYANAMRELLGNIALMGGTVAPLTRPHDEVKTTFLVVIVSDRGLAGGFNSNILRRAERIMKARKAEGKEVRVAVCGKKAIAYFNYRGVEPVLAFRDLSADPRVEQADALTDYVIENYLAGEIDETIVLYNHSKNAAEQIPCTDTLLPVDLEAFIPEGARKAIGGITETDSAQEEIEGSIEFEPGEVEVVDHLLPEYIAGYFYYVLIDSASAEQAARRNAMKNATDNANEMIESLNRLYNRVRQGAITTEINEIVGGAAALED
jgi:F-type H+-transporting ATPase subunit gamma